MRNFLIIFTLFLSVAASAQKFAVVDTKYILENIPDYKAAQQKIEDMSKKWQTEIQAKKVEVSQLVKNYHADKILLSEEMRIKKEEEIAAAETAVQKLQKKRFGKDGDLFKERQKLIKPIQDKVFNAIKDLGDKGKYMMVIDKAGDMSVLYVNPKYDKSDEILKTLGY